MYARIERADAADSMPAFAACATKRDDCSSSGVVMELRDATSALDAQAGATAAAD